MIELSEEDQLRTQWYSILGWILSAPPDRAGLDRIAGLAGDGSDIGAAVNALAAAAKAADPVAVKQEFFDLFIGVGRGELVPHGSYYLTGFLHEKPLARLRRDMAGLGIARSADLSGPEDNIAALFEMMSGLISGAFGAPADLARQRDFFQNHVGCWAPRFFEDLQAAEAASFYMPVGTLGRLFMAIEAEAFEMAA